MNNYGFCKVSACSFPIKLGNVTANAEQIINIVKTAQENAVSILVFPELCLTGYTCGDLFLRNSFYEKILNGLTEILNKTKQINTIFCIGMPVIQDNRIFNCAVWCYHGSVKGIVPKSYIPNYGEFYEKRWFVPASCRTADTVRLLHNTNYDIPFTENLILDLGDSIKIGTEICEDLWIDTPPSGLLSRAGATIIANLSASNDTIGKTEYRRNLVAMQSARCRCAYIYASSGTGESSTDLIFSGHVMIGDNGKLAADDKNTTVTAVIDVEKYSNDRHRFNSESYGTVNDVKIIPVPFTTTKTVKPDTVNPYPFVPKDKYSLHERCREIIDLQARGLERRLQSLGDNHHMILGLSGGLDSTLALLVCNQTAKRMQIPTSHIHCISMPGFGTSSRTKENAKNLSLVFGTSFEEINITDACMQHLKDINHAADVYDITFENTQARERTQILFDYANMHNGIVIGTGDMSELALGWCTYNGDHMSNYAVNASVPKTLVRHIVETMAAMSENAYMKQILHDICDTPISPELLPTDSDGNMTQKTEDSIGKYDLHDFFLYHFLRNGFSAEKINFLAQIAFPELSKNVIQTTLCTFMTRFKTQQFKRSCIPDGIKIGSVSLSPRGDLRLPSDLAALDC